MAVDVFHNPTKSIPKGDSRIVRVEFDKQDQGARKSHISGIAPKNSNVIKHVSGS